MRHFCTAKNQVVCSFFHSISIHVGSPGLRLSSSCMSVAKALRELSTMPFCLFSPTRMQPRVSAAVFPLC